MKLMYVLDVIPLIFIPRNQAQILSYFFNEPLGKGTVVEVLINKRRAFAVVIGSNSIKNLKFNLKKGVSFELKNIKKVISRDPLVSGMQLKIAAYISDRYYSPLGLSLKTALPSFFCKKNYHLPPAISANDKNNGAILAQFGAANQWHQYEKTVKEKILNGRQVFLMTAENLAAKYLAEKLKKLNPSVISASVGSKAHAEIWHNTAAGKTKLIIGTRAGLFLPFKKLGLIIVDDESSGAYKSDMSPRYNGADLARYIALLHGSDILLCSAALRLETYHLFKPLGINTQPKGRIISNIGEIRAGNFSIFSRELKENMAEALSQGERVILYIPRRGYSNFLLCQHCQIPVACPNCTASLVLHKNQNGQELLICHRCNYRQNKPKQCPKCGSYKVKFRGIGTEKVVENLKALNLGRNVFKLDSDESGNDDALEEKIIEKFKNTSSSILVTTQIVFSHIYNLPRVPIIGIINADTLINIPDFRAEESLFRQIFSLGRLGDKIIIQTHSPDNPAIRAAANGEISEFYQKELGNRKTFGYPPFSELIKLSFRHRDDHRAANEARILHAKLDQEKKRLGLAEVEIMPPSPAFISREKGNFIWNIILKTKTAGQISEIRRRNQLLRLVLNGWVVDVDPRSTI